MTAIKRDSGTDWAKADAYANTPEDYDELPELDGDFFERATFKINGKPVHDQPSEDRRIDAERQSPPWQGQSNATSYRREPMSK